VQCAYASAVVGFTSSVEDEEERLLLDDDDEAPTKSDVKVLLPEPRCPHTSTYASDDDEAACALVAVEEEEEASSSSSLAQMSFTLAFSFGAFLFDRFLSSSIVFPSTSWPTWGILIFN